MGISADTIMVHFAGRWISGDIGKLHSAFGEKLWGSLYSLVRSKALQLINHHAHPDEFLLTLNSFVLQSKGVLARLLEEDRCLFLGNLASEAQISADARVPRQARQRYHKLLRFGGEMKNPLPSLIC